MRSKRSKKNLSGRDSLRETISPAGSRRKVSFTGQSLTGYEPLKLVPREFRNWYTWRADRAVAQERACTCAKSPLGRRNTDMRRWHSDLAPHPPPTDPGRAARIGMNATDDEAEAATAPRQTRFPTSSWPQSPATLRTHGAVLGNLFGSSTPRGGWVTRTLSQRVAAARFAASAFQPRKFIFTIVNG